MKNISLRDFVARVVEKSNSPLKIERWQKNGESVRCRILFDGCTEPIEFHSIGENIRFKFSHQWHDLDGENNDVLLQGIIKTLSK
jgi:hypothetical protein